MLSRRSDFSFIANSLCLDFVNTEIIVSGKPVDALLDFRKYLGWLVEAGLLSEKTGDQYFFDWNGTGYATSALRAAHQLRPTLRQLAQHLSTNATVDVGLIGDLNAFLKSCFGHVELSITNNQVEKHFRCEASSPIALLYPVAESMVQLLTEGDLSRVRRCENSECVLFFYDTSKNRTRRWCQMSTCGNRVKVASYYRRKRDHARG